MSDTDDAADGVDPQESEVRAEGEVEESPQEEVDARYVNVPTGVGGVRSRRPGMSSLQKIILVIMLPVLTALAVLLIIQTRQREFTEYKVELVGLGEEFVKTLEADRIGEAYDMLLDDLRSDVAAETMEAEYKAAASGLGKYVAKGPVEWAPVRNRKAPTSYTLRLNYEKGAIAMSIDFTPTGRNEESGAMEYGIRHFAFKQVP